MFAVVGTMRTYLQQFQLKKSAKQKMKTGESFDWKDAKTTFVKAQEEARAAAPKTIVEMTLEKSKKKDDDRTVKAKTGSIKQKLKRGKKLSADELEYLRQHDEKLYKKAKVTMEEREKLARALKSAKTKAEAMRAVAIAYANAAAACSDAIDSASGGGVSGGAVSAGDAGASAEGAASFDTGVSMDANASVGAEAGAATADASMAGDAANVSAGAETAASPESTATDAMDATNAEADAANEASADGTENAKSAVGTGADEDEKAENTSSALDRIDKNDGGEFDEPLILLVLRHLQAEWQDFMHTKQYKSLPEDETQAAKRHDAPKIRQRSEAVKAVSLTAVATAYQSAELDNAASHILGSVGEAK